jgi:hypothetical protein
VNTEEGTEGMTSADTIGQQFDVVGASHRRFSFSLQRTAESKMQPWFTATPFRRQNRNENSITTRRML